MPRSWGYPAESGMRTGIVSVIPHTRRYHQAGHALLFSHSPGNEGAGRANVAKETFTRLIDDLDGGVAHETVTFGIDGSTYQIDLSSKHAKKLRADLAPYIESGNRVSLRATRGGRGRGAA